MGLCFRDFRPQSIGLVAVGPRGAKFIVVGKKKRKIMFTNGRWNTERKKGQKSK